LVRSEYRSSMTDKDKQRLLEELKEVEYDGDEEQAHVRADNILCEILLDRGDVDFVDAFNRITKWYA
jgi:hypothetical protein